MSQYDLYREKMQFDYPLDEETWSRLREMYKANLQTIGRTNATHEHIGHDHARYHSAGGLTIVCLDGNAGQKLFEKVMVKFPSGTRRYVFTRELVLDEDGMFPVVVRVPTN